MNYTDLSIHKRITAKANALVYYSHMKGSNILARVSSRPPEFFTPDWPEYLMKYNFKEPKNPGRL
jgi:hypothetical protein